MTAWPALFLLGPFEAKRALGGAAAWATILTVGSIGAVAGGLLTLRVRIARPLLVGEIACLAVALPIAFIALHVPVAVIAGGMFLSSAGVTLADALWHTTMQRHLPEQAISRVSAIDWTATLALSPIGFALIGVVATGIGIRTTLFAAAALTASAVLATIAIPSVRNLRVDLDEGAAERPPAIAAET